MTLEERCKHYRNEARRYKRKYLILRNRLESIRKSVLKITFIERGVPVVFVDELMPILDYFSRKEDNSDETTTL